MIFKIIGYTLEIGIELILLPIKLISSLFIHSVIPKSLSNNKNSLDKPKNKQKYSDKELDKYGLWKDEKELVQDVQYDPWDFVENEMLDDIDSYRDEDIE